MGLFDKIKEFVAGEEESPVTAASVLAKVREKYPHLQGIDDLSLSQSLYKKDPAKFSYLKTYAPDTTVPPALVPKSMRDDAFYKANPQEGTKDALKVIEQVKSKFPKYKGVDAKRLAVALETKNPTMFAGLSKKLMPEQTAIPKGEAEAAVIPLIPSGTMGATKPVSPVQVTAPVKPVVAKPEVRGRPTVVSISPMEAKLPAGTKPLQFKSGNEAYLSVEKMDKPTLVEYPNRHGQMIQRVLTKQSFETQPPVDAKKGITAKIVGKEEAFARGVGVSGAQVPELAYGATALVADSAERLFGSGTASRVKDWALRGYQRASKVSEEVHGDEVKSVVESWKEAKKGNLDALGDWLSYWSGYGAGQLGESAAVAFLGGLVGSVVPGPGTAAGAVAGVTAKTATKGVIRGALERLVERQALKLTAEGVAAAEAKRLAVKQIATAIGAASAIGAYAVVQEGGSIYPDAVKKAEEDGRKLNGYDLGRVWGTTLVAAGAEGLGDMLGLGFLTGNVRIPGRLGKVARIVGTAASGGLAEGGTEAIQTAVERVGAGRKPFDQAGIQDIIESAAAGAIPGLGAGGVGAIISGQPRVENGSLASTAEASPELLNYLDRVEKINREQASDVTESQQKEDVTKGPARAEFIGYQEGLPEDTPIPLYNVMGESPRALSTVGSEELKSLGIETPKTPSFEEWKAAGDVTEGQVSAKKLIEKLASANEISDAVAVEFVKHITPTGENFYKSYGEEFSPEKFRVLGATIPQYTQNGLNFAIKLAQGAKESTGAHEMFHAMKQMGFFSQDEMRVLEGRFGNEEKIADALGEYATRRTGAEAQSRIKAIFDRFLDFVKRVGSMLVGRGWTRAEDIFESVVKGRPEKIGNQKSGHPMFKAEPKDQTQTPEFKRWFGNSKVVGTDGKPLVVYHGTSKDFTQFRMGVRGIHWFTSNPSEASNYSEADGWKGANVKPLFASIKNPAGWDEYNRGDISQLESAGYDGVIIKDKGGSLSGFVFDPKKLKSATGNSGAFDPNNPSILYQAERIGDIPESVYAENRKFKPNRSAASKAGEFLTSAKDQAETLLTPISSVLADISPMLRVALRREAFREGLNRHNDTKAIIPFLEAANKMRRDDAADLDLALKNGDSAKINQVIQSYGLESEYAKVRKTLDAIHARAKEVGYDVGYLEEYWPRVIKDQAGFLKEIQADKKWPDIEKLIKTKEEELTRPLSEDEKVELINSYLRGYQNAVIALARTPNMKTRDIEVIGPGLNQHFRRFDDAVLKYVESMNHAIEAKRFFGRGGKDFFIDELDKSIGGYVLDMKSQGLLKDARDEKRLRDILQAYFRPESMHGAMAAYKNATVSMTIGNAVAALTQLQDIGTSIYRAPVESVGALARSAVGGSKITLEDIGIDQIGEELRDQRKSAMFTSKVLRLAGLGKLDKITAETFINSVIRKYQKQARKPSAEFMDRIRNLVGPETAKAIEDLKSGEITDLVKFIAFSEILGVQPKAMTELPRAYLSGGNARIFYALKTFQLRQIDMFRQEIFKKMAEPGLKNKIIGTRRLIALSSALLLAGVGTDELKDFILGRTTTLSDRIVDNILKLVGLSKWTLYKARQEGIASAAIKTILPPVPLVDQLWKDIRTAGDKKGLEVVQSIPLVGKFYYWWMGKGRFKKPLNDDMRWLKENAGRLGLTRSKAYQYLNRTSTRSLLAETEKERTEARAKVESYAKRLRAMAESREAELLAREERRKARLAARR